ncbi:hypothetical protein BSZ35_03510 [Salinibacter sp. 10B]|uniref:DUF192 domain-containing protein n=1 Tax=Salinibacter sp. 10B TaxID=1923971 RepID=UPI000CF428D9|nr:DUF192 domain-containing protein [Salinibacter sp. 10B]PQJ33792.1 hypothetical protein BSZ35_03510 [Salinibacter sp. 10B]
MLIRFLPVLLLFGLTFGCTSNETESETKDLSFQEGTLAFVQPNGDTLTTIALAIADSDAERTRGLMRQRSLGYERGMLFIFDAVDTGGMWMRNTPLPLDIVFVAPDSQVINIARRTTPFSEKTIEPDGPRKFVVEVRAGFADRFGLTDSTRVRWTRTP